MKYQTFAGMDWDDFLMVAHIVPFELPPLPPPEPEIRWHRNPLSRTGWSPVGLASYEPPAPSTPLMMWPPQVTR